MISHDFPRTEHRNTAISSFVAYPFLYTIYPYALTIKYTSSIKDTAWHSGMGIPGPDKRLSHAVQGQRRDLRFVTRTTTSQVTSTSTNFPWNPSILTPSLARYQLLTLQMRRKNYSIIFEVIFSVFSNPPTIPEIDFLGG